MDRTTDTDKQVLCSFCGRSQRQVKKMITGNGVFICDVCIDICGELIDDELAAAPTVDLGSLPKPREISAVLDDYVIGQESAKRSLSVAVYNHY